LAGQDFDCFEAVYVLDEGSHLIGIILWKELWRAASSASVQALMNRQFATARLQDDQEQVASLAVQYGMNAVPVVDAGGHFVGVVPAQALIAILRREHIEDLHRLSGIQGENSLAVYALEAPPTRRAGRRLPWLLVGLAGSILATFVVSRFEQALTHQLSLAFFVPGIVYLADAIGTQTEAIAVRGLCLRHEPLGSLLRGELATGLIIGSTLGVISLPLVLIAFRDWGLALTVALTIVTAGGLATSVGLLFPWLLDQLGTDPAFGSGPVATIIQDILSLLTYFWIAQFILL
jgi:magnesium transporter